MDFVTNPVASSVLSVLVLSKTSRLLTIVKNVFIIQTIPKVSIVFLHIQIIIRIFAAKKQTSI